MPLLPASLIAKEGGLSVLVLWKIRPANSLLWSFSGHCGEEDSENNTQNDASELVCLTLSYSSGWSSFCPKAHQRNQNLPTQMLIIETRSIFPKEKPKMGRYYARTGRWNATQEPRRHQNMVLCCVPLQSTCPCFSKPTCANGEFSLSPQYDGTHVTENYEPPKMLVISPIYLSFAVGIWPLHFMVGRKGATGPFLHLQMLKYWAVCHASTNQTQVLS